MLYRIVYLSKAAKAFHENEIVALAAHANRRNAANGVTGLLLYDGRRFIQAMEGSKSAVIETMNRIAEDRHHLAITYLYDGITAHQQFGDWSMRYQPALEKGSSQRFLDDVKTTVSAVADPYLQAAFIGFAVLCNHTIMDGNCTVPVLDGQHNLRR